MVPTPDLAPASLRTRVHVELQCGAFVERSRRMAGRAGVGEAHRESAVGHIHVNRLRKRLRQRPCSSTSSEGDGETSTPHHRRVQMPLPRATQCPDRRRNEPARSERRRRGARYDHGGCGEDGLGTAPVVGERARWACALARAERDSERHVVVDEEPKLPVMARTLAIATFVVVAADLSELLSVEGDSEVVEDIGELNGALVAQLVGNEEVRQAHSRNSATACFGRTGPLLRFLQHQAPSQRTGPTHPRCGVLRPGSPRFGSLKPEEDFTYRTVHFSGSISGRWALGEPEFGPKRIEDLLNVTACHVIRT